MRHPNPDCLAGVLRFAGTATVVATRYTRRRSLNRQDDPPGSGTGRQTVLTLHAIVQHLLAVLSSPGHITTALVSLCCRVVLRARCVLRPGSQSPHR